MKSEGSIVELVIEHANVHPTWVTCIRNRFKIRLILFLSGPELGISSQNPPDLRSEIWDLRSRSRSQISDLRSEISNRGVPPSTNLEGGKQGAESLSYAEIYRSRTLPTPLDVESEKKNDFFFSPDLRSEIWDLRSRSQIWKPRSRSGPLRNNSIQ